MQPSTPHQDDVEVVLDTPSVSEPERSLGDLVGAVGSDLGELVSMHIDLAKTEIKEEIADAAKTVGVFGASAFAGYMTVVFLSFTAALVLAVWLPMWSGFLIVTGVWAVGALVLALNGRARSAELNAVPEQTVETVKEDVAWVRHPTI